MRNPRILVLGAGGIGGYFGGRLAEAGANVTFLVRENRQLALQSDGLKIASPFGDAQVRVATIVASKLNSAYDVVLMTCKAYDLGDAMCAITPAMSASSVVLPLLNGVAHIDLLNRTFGAERVLGGSAKIQATLTEDGTVRQLNDWRFLTLGEQSGEMSERVRSIASLFGPTKGVEVEAVSDIMQRLWEKLVHLATAATMTCLMRANVGEIVRTPHGRAQFLHLLNTVSDVAARNGHRPSVEFTSIYRDIFSDANSAYATSMLRDIERKGRIEADHIIGYVRDKAMAVCIDDQTLALAFTHVKAYEQRLLVGRV
jgi:2-dehydropantoate 2-reductase